MRVSTILIILFFKSIITGQTLIGNQINGNKIDDDTGSAVAISKDGQIIVVGSQKIKNSQNKDIGETRAYKLINGAWTQLGNTIPGVEPHTNSGGRVDIDHEGKRIILGALFNNNGGSGRVRVMELQNNQWVQLGSNLGNVNTFTNVGFDVKISGNGKRIAFSIMKTTDLTSISCDVLMYEWSGTQWLKLGNTLSSVSTFDGFGLDIDLDYTGENIIIGAPTAELAGVGRVGEFSVFNYESGLWKLKGQKVKGVTFAALGTDVAINNNGSSIVVGSAETVNQMLFAGAVRVYDFVNNEWTQRGTAILGKKANEAIGNTVTISGDGDVIVFGSATLNGNKGGAFIYKYKSGDWIAAGNPIVGIDTSDRLGINIEIAPDGRSFIVGATVGANMEKKPGYAQVWSIDKDEDCDGFNDKVDCNDTNPAINPGAAEACDNIDNNCNNQIDEGLPVFTYYIDKDGDGFGVQTDAITTCNTNIPSGYVTNNTDCDDGSSTINPGVVEICDNIDNNCNNLIDDGLTLYNYYVDKDGDGYGIQTDALTTCNVNIPSGYVANNTDCDDGNSAINPGVVEICDNIDNNCNIMIDDGLPVFTYYADVDGDGFGTTTNSVQKCQQPEGHVSNNEDCDDGNKLINPNAQEIPNNGVDEDCNGSDLLTDISELQNELINIYPNPANYQINISNKNNYPFELEIYTLDGQHLLNQRDINKLDVSTFINGIYILKVTTHQSKINYTKMIIQH